MNILQSIALDKVGRLFEYFQSSFQPDYFIDALDYAWQCSVDEDFFDDYTTERYWLLCQKICCAAMVKLTELRLIPVHVPKNFIGEGLLLPDVHNYWNLMGSEHEDTIGLGLHGTKSLQRFLYRLAGWNIEEKFLSFEHPDLFSDSELIGFIQKSFPKRCWGKVMHYLYDMNRYYLENDYVLIYLHYPDIDESFIEHNFLDLLLIGGTLHIPSERYILYFCPVERYPTLNISNGTDLSSLNLTGAWLAYLLSLKEPLLIPEYSSFHDKEGRAVHV